MLSQHRAPLVVRRWVLHPLQALLALAAYGVFRLLPLRWASAAGGLIGRVLGPHLSITERARRNLALAFPEKPPAERAAIVRGMWDNLGRVFAEFPHLSEIDVYDPAGPVEVVGGEHVDALRDDGRPGFFFSGHLGNWEIVSLSVTQRGVPLDRIYRAANNRMVEWLYRHGRAAVEGALIPKGAAGAKRLLGLLRRGSHLGMLVDQKMNDGIAVPFFGRDAMTAPALAQLALRYDCPVVAARVVRLTGARFRLVLLPPFHFERTGDRQADVHAAMARVNGLLEGWIRDTPEQWLWLHNRWPD